MIARWMMLLTAGLIALTVSTGAPLAQTQSNVRFGLGVNATDYEMGTNFLPAFVIDMDTFSMDLGAKIETGENQTNFYMHGGFAVEPIQSRSVDMGFGAQFDLITDIVTGNQKSTGFGFGAFVAASMDITPHFGVSLRGYPIMMDHAKDYSRIGVAGVGFSMTYFF